jgi:hypothetical protein|nr:MAG TPA: hypothetical protein [Caudoviricetes sp.]
MTSLIARVAIITTPGNTTVHMEAIPMDFIKLPVVYTCATNRGTLMKLLIITMNEIKLTKEVKVSKDCFILKDPYTKD